MTHHPSCRPSDKRLVWHCNQCGLNEPAGEVEQAIEDATVKLRERITEYAIEHDQEIAKLRDDAEAWRLTCVGNSNVAAHQAYAEGYDAGVEADRRSLNPVLCERIDKLREALRHIQDCGDLASARAIAYAVLTGTEEK